MSYQEAIAGKCYVVCISKDSRNPQPSDEELQLAEFVFYRFFDVGQRKILDKIDDKIAGVEGMLIDFFINYSLKFLIVLRWNYITLAMFRALLHTPF